MTMTSDGDNRPWSEIFRLAGEDWVEKEAAAQLLEDTKSAVLAQRMLALGDIAVNRAEQKVKASPFWTEHVTKIVMARKAANQAKVHMEYTRTQMWEWNNSQANARSEMRLV